MFLEVWTLPEPAAPAAVSPGSVEPPRPPPAAPPKRSFPPPAGGFGCSSSASDASLPAAAPAQEATRPLRLCDVKPAAFERCVTFSPPALEASYLQVLQFAAQLVHLFDQFHTLRFGLLQQTGDVVQFHLTQERKERRVRRSGGQLAGGAVGLHLEPVRALAQLCLGLLCLSSSGQELLQLSLPFLPSVLGFGLCLLQAPDLSAQLFVVTLQILEVLLQVAFELGQERQAVTFPQSCGR